MRRRAFLVAAGAGAVSGCAGLGLRVVPVPREIDALTVSTDKIYPTHTYHFVAKRCTSETTDARDEKPRITYTDIDAALQPIVHRLVTLDRDVAFDDPPDGLLDLADEYVIDCAGLCSRYAYAEIGYVRTDPTAPPVAEVTAVAFNKAWTSGVELSLRNTLDHPLAVMSGVAPPFGVLHAVGTDGTDNQFTLWSDAYAEDEQISVRGGKVLYPDGGGRFEVAAGSTVTRTYSLTYQLADRFVRGGYVLSERSDGTAFVFGERTGIPFVVSYSSPGLSTMEYIDFRIEFELI